MSSTSIILALRKGFFMYHVEVKNVRAHSRISFFPESSRLSGLLLTNTVWYEKLEKKCEFNGH